MEEKLTEHKQSVKQIFDTVAPQYGLGGCRFFHLAGQHMAGMLPLTGTEQVLDVAAGTGATSLPLAKKLPQGKVMAVDLSDAMLTQARNTAEAEGLNNLMTATSDFMDLPFMASEFDHATCAFGLFFVPEMSQALRHIASKVKRNGQVIISGFCGDSFLPAAQLCLDRLQHYGLEIPEQIAWKRMSEPDQLHTLFRDAGLTRVDIDRQSMGYPVSLDEWWEVIWNAGFRGLVAQLGDKLDEFKAAHLAELKTLCTSDGRLWLEVDVNFSRGIVV